MADVVRWFSKSDGRIQIIKHCKGRNVTNIVNQLLSLQITRIPLICNGNRTEWSPIRSVIIRVITQSDDRVAGDRFVYHEYDYRPN